MPSIRELEEKAKKAIENASDREALFAFKNEYLGRSGILSLALRGVKDLPERERKSFGERANALKEELEELFRAKSASLERAEKERELGMERVDITLPGKKIESGHLHPLTSLRRQVEEIFSSMGFEVVEGPEIETEYYNFDALNIPADHPARDMWDTFWLEPQNGKEAKLLRTHTSPVQIRYMQTHQPPFRIIAPGKVFRYEATDASHDIEFYQVEGLAVGTDISVANFKDVILSFFKALFGKEVKIRLRPSYFPFVEPGFEVDMSCIQCHGEGCSVCKQTGWLEMMGAGLVHPNVFKAVGYNPKLCQGFAFGVGLDRIAMMKYKIPDIRFFHANDIRFLRQF